MIDEREPKALLFGTRRDRPAMGPADGWAQLQFLAIEGSEAYEFLWDGERVAKAQMLGPRKFH